MATDNLNNKPQEEALLVKLHHATRSEHAALNRAIVAHLPLCLPPTASDPYFYAAGMTVYGQIYTALEESWLRVLEESEKCGAREKQYEMLVSLRTRYLNRNDRLTSDLANLRRNLDPQALATLDQLRIQSLHFHRRISNAISAKPHLVLAYAWPMYLALFNGGRWIVSQMLNAGESFWQTETSQIAEECLSFWYFADSVHDGNHGENVKLDFKQRLTRASELLTAAERDEVVEEAKQVFAICQEMIELLDQHALSLVSSQTTQTPSSSADNVLKRMASYLPLKGLWQRLGTTVGYVAAPTGLRKDFEQRI